MNYATRCLAQDEQLGQEKNLEECPILPLNPQLFWRLFGCVLAITQKRGPPSLHTDIENICTMFEEVEVEVIKLLWPEDEVK